jgi:protein-tyrosine-phosphatase
MKIVVFDLDGVNTAPVAKTILAAKYPNAEVVVAKASDKGDARKTTSRFRKAAKAVLGLEVEKQTAATLTADLVSRSDVVVYENSNNLKLAARRLGKDFLGGKQSVCLNMEPSGHHVKDEELEAYLKTLQERVDGITVGTSAPSPQPSASA